MYNLCALSTLMLMPWAPLTLIYNDKSTSSLFQRKNETLWSPEASPSSAVCAPDQSWDRAHSSGARHATNSAHTKAQAATTNGSTNPSVRCDKASAGGSSPRVSEALAQRGMMLDIYLHFLLSVARFSLRLYNALQGGWGNLWKKNARY